MKLLTAGGHSLEHAWIGPSPGEATTLVFLHEGLGCVSTWRDFPTRLAEATGCGALVYSRAGYGGSSPVVRNRNMAVRALAAWGRAGWPEEAEELLRRALGAEPVEETRETMRKVLAGESTGDGFA